MTFFDFSKTSSIFQLEPKDINIGGFSRFSISAQNDTTIVIFRDTPIHRFIIPNAILIWRFLEWSWIIQCFRFLIEPYLSIASFNRSICIYPICYCRFAILLSTKQPYTTKATDTTKLIVSYPWL